MPPLDSVGVGIDCDRVAVTPIRPKFTNPPLIERAISVHFAELSGFTLGDYGLFWSIIRDGFPLSESAGRTPPNIEQYDGFRPAEQQISIVDGGSLPRALFRNATSGELVQIQPDRFTFNWIKTGVDHAYPHSEVTLERFFDLLTLFERFAADRGLGALQFDQCELTNVNVVPVEDVGETLSDVATVVKLPDVANPCRSVRLEQQIVGSRHIFTDEDGRPLGRVHTMGQPAIRAQDSALAFRLDIVARGAPLSTGRKGLEDFFNLAVSAVNGVFLASVTQAGRKFWGEQDGYSI
ncbi:TIGR04255 family protein [Sphingomonas sp.]|uniref:TIGR04255 family protein n=1 Tax=Sphingomonas sp. TaxID=28214 RepID=UPI0025DF58F5|nr:TIGR04255 family protein [Sphingomonas sp.]